MMEESTREKTKSRQRVAIEPEKMKLELTAGLLRDIGFLGFGSWHPLKEFSPQQDKMLVSSPQKNLET